MSDYSAHITRAFDEGFYYSFDPNRQATPLKGPFQVSVAGRQYAVDLSFKPYRRDAFRHRSLPNERASLNFDNIPGRGVLDPAGMWRRDQIDWSLGAGQLYLDHKKSADNRFYMSKGVDPMTNQWKLSMLNDTTQHFTLQGAFTWVKPLVLGQYRYFLEHDTLCYEDVSAPGTLHTVNLTGISTGTGHYFSDITGNGQYVFVAQGTSGIWYWPIGDHTTAPTHYIIQSTNTSGQAGYTFTGVTWAADVLWATGQQHVYVFGASVGGATVAGPHTPGTGVNANETIPDVLGPGWVWTDFAEANSQVYLAGYYISGSVKYGGAVYRIGQAIATAVITNVTTTTYLAPVRALQLTPGEWPSALHPYLNYLFVGTSLGVRMCRTLSLYDPTATSTGDLEGGAVIPNILQPVTSPVTDFTSNGRWVYFAWCNYDSTSTGIGRMDVQTFIDDLTPAYCSHYMVGSSWGGTVQSTTIFLEWDTINNAPMIAVSDPTSGTPGVYVQAPALVKTATLNTGWLTYDIPDDKVLIKGHFGLGQAFGELDMLVSTNNSQGQLLPLAEVHSETAVAGNMGQMWFLSPYLRGDEFQFQIQFKADSIATSAGPILSNWTMWGQPIYVPSETTISVVLMLFNKVTVEGADKTYEPYEEYNFLDTLRREQAIIEYVEGPISAQVVITSIDWLPEQPMGRYKRGYQADAVVYMQTINGFTYTPELLS